MPPPALNEPLRLEETAEDLPLQQFVPQLAVEAIEVAIYSLRSGLNAQRLHVKTPSTASSTGTSRYGGTTIATVHRIHLENNDALNKMIGYCPNHSFFQFPTHTNKRPRLALRT